MRSVCGIPGVQAVAADLLDHASLKEAVRGVDVVVHCAVDESGDVDRGRAANVEGTRVLAEAAALAVGCRRFVHISTCGAYALEGLDVVTEGTPLWPESRIEELVYGGTKALGEQALTSVVAQGLDAVVLRPPNVLGVHPRSVFCEELATRVRFSTDRIRSELGYAPRRTYRDAMEETRAFLGERGMLPAPHVGRVTGQ